MTALSDVLKSELRERFQRGNSLVVWLDADEVYTSFVDRLATDEGFHGEVVGFRGSFLETLFALEGHANGLDPERLVLHVPGYNKQTIRDTPLLELYRAGRGYEKKFTTLVRETATGKVEPEEIERFVSADPSDFDDAERWLESRSQRAEDGLEGWLEGLEDDWLVLLRGLFDPRSEGRKLYTWIKTDPDGVEILRGVLHRRTGLSTAFVDFYLGRGTRSPGGDPGGETQAEVLCRDELIRAFAAWLMCVEYVHDLRVAPRLPELQALRAPTLPAPLVERCRELVVGLREHLPKPYVELAAEVEAHLAAELDHVDPRDLGRIDTFEKEADRMLEAAVAALREGRFADTLEWSSLRPATSFWLRHSRVYSSLERQKAWELAEAAGRLGHSLEEHGRPLAGAVSLDDATERYASQAFEVDLAHRRFEQLRLNVLGQMLPHAAEMRGVTDNLRDSYRQWADELTEAFTGLCELHGFLPSAERQQRTFFEQVIQPLLESSLPSPSGRGAGDEGAVVLFLVDALRFEMARDLAERFDDGVEVRLAARLAELPTVTPVGMNVLAPVVRGGRLEPRFKSRGRTFDGFRTGEFTVSSPDERIDAMRQRSFGGGAASQVVGIDLAVVCDALDKTLKRRLAGARLVVVHSREIDESGESDAGLATFESWLQRLADAWHRLKALSFGTFVFTADHGFLIQDVTTADPQKYGPKLLTPKKRWTLAPEAERPEGCVTVPLKALGYDTGSSEGDLFLILRNDTKVFATGTSATSFCHGGNSLQERVVPVLTVTWRSRSRLRLERYRIEAAGKAEQRAGIYRLPLQVRPREEAQSVLEIARERDLAVALEVVGDGGVDKEDVTLVIHDVEGGETRRGQWRAPVGKDVVVCFDLRGPRDARVKIRVYHPEGDGRVEEWRPETFFEVAGRGVPSREPETRTEDEPLGTTAASLETTARFPRGDQGGKTQPSWAEAFDEKTARVFVHLERHGSITEDEIATLLGGARPTRRFALAFDEHIERVPFGARVEMVGGVKRYVREN